MNNKISNPDNYKNLEKPVKKNAITTQQKLKNVDYNKKVITKEDGRYLIYYDFKKNKN